VKPLYSEHSGDYVQVFPIWRCSLNGGSVCLDEKTFSSLLRALVDFFCLLAFRLIFSSHSEINSCFLFMILLTAPTDILNSLAKALWLVWLDSLISFSWPFLKTFQFQHTTIYFFKWTLWDMISNWEMRSNWMMKWDGYCLNKCNLSFLDLWYDSHEVHPYSIIIIIFTNQIIKQKI
jgi:hypothetical protein